MDPRINERFHLYPEDRIKALTVTAATIGGLSGFYDGIKSSSLRYLTENSHRLPKTVGGWYFYHKKKNYVMIINGVKSALKQSTKFSFIVGLFFTLEHLIDRARGTTDLFSTIASSATFSFMYGYFNNLSRFQIRSYMFKGIGLGLSMGFAQDMLIFSRGGRVWYLEKLGIRREIAQAEVPL